MYSSSSQRVCAEREREQHVWSAREAAFGFAAVWSAECCGGRACEFVGHAAPGSDFHELHSTATFGSPLATTTTLPASRSSSVVEPALQSVMAPSNPVDVP